MEARQLTGRVDERPGRREREMGQATEGQARSAHAVVEGSVDGVAPRLGCAALADRAAEVCAGNLELDAENPQHHRLVATAVARDPLCCHVEPVEWKER